MADRMPPPGMTLVIGVGKPDANGKPGRMPPPGTDTSKPQPGDSGKVSPDQATIIRSDEHCIDCSHYSPTTGECEKIDGSFDPQDACTTFFEPLSGDEETDEPADQTTDQDGDDQPGVS